MTIYNFGGQRVRMGKADLNNDGVISGIEELQRTRPDNVHYLKDTTELGEVLEHQNKDVIDQTGFSSSDFIANINSFQFSPLVVIDLMSTMRMTSKESRDVVRHILRKSVSIDAMGREHFIDAVAGKHSKDMQKASMSNVAGVQSGK